MRECMVDLASFHEFIVDKKCYCFGAGLQGLHLIYMFENWNCLANIISFIDNDPDKRNTIWKVENHLFKIESIDDITEDIKKKNAVMIITCADVVGIKEQLNRIDAFDDVLCFDLTSLAQNQLKISQYDSVVKETKKAIIPKIIHYCWFGNAMPENLRRNIAKWREICPDYEIKEWNESNYDVTKCQYMYEAYQLGKWGFVPDYIRLDLIYRYGGIYLDTDICILKKPDDLLFQHAFGISDASFFLNFGSGFGAAPHQDIIKEYRDYYQGCNFAMTNNKYDKKSCMLHQYIVAREHGYQFIDKIQNVGGMNIYPMIMSGTNPYALQMRVTEDTYWLHYGNATWIGDGYHKAREKNSKLSDNGLTSYVLG